MPTPPKSTVTHIRAGTYRKDRHGTINPFSLQPINPKPPAHLPEAMLPAWHELVTAGESFLAESDRIAVELAAAMLTRMRLGKCSAAETAQLIGLLGRMGLSPTGRRGLDTLSDPTGPANPFDDMDPDGDAA